MDVGQLKSPSFDSSSLPSRLSIKVAQLQPTDRPIEDRFSVVFDTAQKRLIVGVFDGHGGSDTADHISKVLPQQLLAHPPTNHAKQFMQLDNSILDDFKRDHSLFRGRSPDWARHAHLIKSGCTALVVDVDMDSLVGHYSNAGDCRLVVCNPTHNPQEVLAQTDDLNAKSPSEKERLSQEHPNEDEIIVGGRLFGRVMSTRGFGDGYYKLPKGLFGDAQHRKFIETLDSVQSSSKVPMSSQYSIMFYAYKTPPYITARPESAKYHFKEGDIAVLASDGLWDLISSSEAAEILIRGSNDNAPDLAKYLLEQVKQKKAPGDDVTIIVVQFRDST